MRSTLLTGRVFRLDGSKGECLTRCKPWKGECLGALVRGEVGWEILKGGCPDLVTRCHDAMTFWWYLNRDVLAVDRPNAQFSHAATRMRHRPSTDAV